MVQGSEKSGGGLFDLHLHDIDLLRYFFGPVETAYAVGYKTPAGCYNHVMSSLKFKSGARAVAEGAFQMSEGYPFTMTFRAVGTKGTLEFVLSAGFNLENLGGASSRLVCFENGKKPEVVKVDDTDAYFREIGILHRLHRERRGAQGRPRAREPRGSRHRLRLARIHGNRRRPAPVTRPGLRL